MAADVARNGFKVTHDLGEQCDLHSLTLTLIRSLIRNVSL